MFYVFSEVLVNLFIPVYICMSLETCQLVYILTFDYVRGTSEVLVHMSTTVYIWMTFVLCLFRGTVSTCLYLVTFVLCLFRGMST